jgi:hypothetical protein
MFNLRMDIALVVRPTCFTYFCFNAPCLYTPLLLLRPLVFDLTPFVWLPSIKLSPNYLIIPRGNIVFYLPFLIYVHFLWNTTRT